MLKKSTDLPGLLPSGCMMHLICHPTTDGGMCRSLARTSAKQLLMSCSPTFRSFLRLPHRTNLARCAGGVRQKLVLISSSKCCRRDAAAMLGEAARLRYFWSDVRTIICDAMHSWQPRRTLARRLPGPAKLVSLPALGRVDSIHPRPDA